MTREQWSRAQPILTRALLLPPQEQKAAIESAFVEEAIRRELMDLLRRTKSVAPRLSLSRTGSGTSDAADPASTSSLPEPVPPALLAPGEPLAGDRFVVVRQLGRGGMGEVYLAHDKVLGNLVALKVLYEGEVREAQHARLCSGHPHIVTMHDVFDVTVGDRTCTVLVMEYVAGKPASRLVDDGPLDLREAVRCARHVAAAMAHAHDRGVLHCDLKPANILITPDEGAKVLDFGIGRATFERANPSEPLRGTAEYMAPEQLLERQFSEAGDVYSLGVTLFELVTGRLPFEGSTAEVMLQIVGAEPPRASAFRDSIPPKLDEILARALAKDPKDRYRTARALDRALDQVEHELTTRTSPVPAPLIAPIPPGQQRAWVRSLKYLALVLAIGAGSGLLTTGTFNLTFDRPRAYDPDSLARQIALGFQSLVLPATVVSAILGAMAAIQLAGALLLKPLRARLASPRQAFSSKHNEITAVLAHGVVACGVLAVAILFLQFEDITGTFGARASTADPEVFAALRPENRDRQVLYRLSAPVLLALVAAGWSSVRRMASTGGGSMPSGANAAALGAMVLLFVLSQAPYKLLTEHSQAPVVLVDGGRCYLLGENGVDARVYCPGWQAPRVRTVNRTGAIIQECGFEESVFTRTTLRVCEAPRGESQPR